MVESTRDLPGKRRVWQVTRRAPFGEYVYVDALPIDLPEPGWAASSSDLANGLDVYEVNDTMPADLMDDLFNEPSK